VIGFTDAAAATFSATYFNGPADLGISDEEKEYWWGLCHGLWLKSKNNNEPGTDLTDLTFANGADGATIAWEHLKKWILWMWTKKISLPLHYDTVKTWELCHRFKVTLGHHTNGVEIECMVTNISINPNPPYGATVEAIMFYDDEIEEDFDIYDTLEDVLTGDDKWTDVETGGGVETIQDT
jgi:hypothetical protein